MDKKPGRQIYIYIWIYRYPYKYTKYIFYVYLFKIESFNSILKKPDWQNFLQFSISNNWFLYQGRL